LSYIAIEGPIGCGKTTLAGLLAERTGARLVLEKFDENPFLLDFYSDPLLSPAKSHPPSAFQTQLFFLLSRFKQQREMLQMDLFYESVISDYLFVKDRIFASINLTDEELELYTEVEQALGKKVPEPDLVIYLPASVPVLLQRISKRGRSYENHLSSDYLESVVAAYNEYFFHYRQSRMIVLDADRSDFLRRPEEVDRLLEAIYREPHPPVEYLASPTPMFSA
jgi:deoxyguanosine kinase